MRLGDLDRSLPCQMDLIRHFDGKTYEPEHDQGRLSTQFDRVKGLMLDGKWRRLGEIRDEIGGSEAGVSARLRDLRKPRFGGFTVERRRLVGGIYEYRLLK